MKMLKYLGLLFAVFSLISIPTFMIYGSGSRFDSHSVLIQKILATTSLGNLNHGSELVPSIANAAKSRNLAGFMKIKCSKGFKISELYSFGLALGNETFMGSENSPRGTPTNKTVKTVERCSLGTM